MKKALCIFLLTSYLGFSWYGLVIGTLDSNYTFSRCNKKLIRLEYIFPSYRLGCWLGE